MFGVVDGRRVDDVQEMETRVVRSVAMLMEERDSQ